jgi:hypothetical protein
MSTKVSNKTAKRGYSFIIDGKHFQKEEIFEGRNDSNFFNDIEEEVKDKYGNRLKKIDHTSRIIHLEY